MHSTKSAKQPFQQIHQDGDSFYNDQTGERVSSVAMRVVTTVRNPVVIDPNGRDTVGAIIDEMLGHALDNGDTVESIHFDLSPTEWQAMQEAHERNTSRDAGIAV